MTAFFKPLHVYAARAGWPGGSERFRFYCTEVTTDRETGKPRAYGWHGRLRTADNTWLWTPNPRTFEDWGAWTDITDEQDCDEGVYLNADEVLADGAEYLDRHGDTWRFLGGIKEFLHVKRADEKTPGTGPRHCECAALVARDFGPMTKVTEVAR